MTDEEKLDDDINLDEFNFDDLVVDNADDDTAATGGASAADDFNFDDITATDFNFDDLPGDGSLNAAPDAGSADETLSVLPQETLPETDDEVKITSDAEENDLRHDENIFSVSPEETSAQPVDDYPPAEDGTALENDAGGFAQNVETLPENTDDIFADILPESTAEPIIETDKEDVVPVVEAPEIDTAAENIAAEETYNQSEADALDTDDNGENAIAEDNGGFPAEEAVNDILMNDDSVQDDEAEEIHNEYFGGGTGDMLPDNYDEADRISSADNYPVSAMEESGQIGFLRWYSGSSGDQMFEIARGFESGSFNADEECKTLHVNVGYDTYGWEVQFSDGVVMNLRDVREYQIRNGRLPSAEGRIIYGQSTLMFSGIERIVVYESVKYFSYGI